MWNDDLFATSGVALDSDITVEYWLGGGLTPAQIAANGNQLVNADASTLYFDEHAGGTFNTTGQIIWEIFDPGIVPGRGQAARRRDRPAPERRQAVVLGRRARGRGPARKRSAAAAPGPVAAGMGLAEALRDLGPDDADRRRGRPGAGVLRHTRRGGPRRHLAAERQGGHVQAGAGHVHDPAGRQRPAQLLRLFRRRQIHHRSGRARGLGRRAAHGVHVRQPAARLRPRHRRPPAPLGERQGVRRLGRGRLDRQGRRPRPFAGPGRRPFRLPLRHRAARLRTRLERPSPPLGLLRP